MLRDVLLMSGACHVAYALVRVRDLQKPIPQTTIACRNTDRPPHDSQCSGAWGWLGLAVQELFQLAQAFFLVRLALDQGEHILKQVTERLLDGQLAQLPFLPQIGDAIG
jgi:hypothetical protein